MTTPTSPLALAVRGLILLLVSAGTASAAANCWTIEDPDQRAYCRAVESNSAGQCTAIASYALRQTCRARLGGNKAPCNTIRSEWERRECEARAKSGR